MNLPVDQFIRIGAEYVFLVLTEQTGPDFTFYLRNDKANLIRQILQEESGLMSGEAKDGGAKTNAPGTSPPPEQKFSYSCRINILRLRLDKKDLQLSNKQVILLSKLREAAQEQTPRSHYHRLINCLPDKWKELLLNEPDEKLLPMLLTELHLLLRSDAIKGLLDIPLKLPEAEDTLINRPDVKPNEVFTNYVKFCFLFKDAIKSLEDQLREGRVLASLSYKGNIWSFTFREHRSNTGYEPNPNEVSDLQDDDADGNLNSVEALCQTLYEEIFYEIFQSETARSGDGNAAENGAAQRGVKEGYKKKIDEHRKITLPEMSGLVVIAGSTNSAKSLITRGLIYLYLENVRNDEKRKRRPHLITFEDPIEAYYAAYAYTPHGQHAQMNVEMEASREDGDYTPRQQKLDAGSLKEALHDALRQTPKVLFVGETREKEDWQELIDFAGTGHLVITTAHAGSLLDTMHKIFLAMEAETPADRSEVASRLLAVVHLKRTDVSKYQYGMVVPALWRRVPRGLNALTAEGLASVLPHSHSDDDNPCSCLGRSYFVRRLLELAEGRNLPPAVRDDLEVKAIDWDLQGA